MDFLKHRGHKLVDRGDLAAYDFTLTNFTFDSSWNELDLSSKIPKGTVFVVLNIEECCGSAYRFMFRTKGNSNEINVSSFRPRGGEGDAGHTILVVPDKDGIIEYHGFAAASCVTFDVTVTDYFI